MASSRWRMGGTCAAASAVLTVTRTISEPARASSKTWAAVRPASAVSVFVIDCTKTGAPPPISACPTRTWRVLCLGMFVIGRSIQRQSGDFDLDVGFQIDRLVVVGKTHGGAVTDNERQVRPPENESGPGKSACAPLIELSGHDDQGEDRKSEISSRTAFAGARKGDALVAQIEVDFPRNVTLLERAQNRLRIRFEQLGVTAHHPAHEGRSGQLVELLGFERLDLTHAVFEALRDVGDRQLTLGAQLREQPSGPGLHGRYVGFDPLVHSNRPFCSSWYSFEPGKRLRSWLAKLVTAEESPTLRSIRNASHNDSAVGSASLL